MRNDKINAWWLCSWFPDCVQEQNGDFIERHAFAASLFSDIEVFHIAPAPRSVLGHQKIKETHLSINTSLRYNIVLYVKKGKQLYSKITSVFQYVFQYKKLIKHHIITSGIPDIVHVHIAFKDGIVALWLKRKYHIPFILSEHWSVYNKDNGLAFKEKSFLFRFLVKKILRNATIILPVSEHLGRTIQSMVPSIRYQVVPNVVNTSVFNYREYNDIKEFTFIHVSSLIDLKNPERIVDAFEKVNQQYPSTRLILIGETKNLKTNITNKNITLIDTVSNEDVAAYLQKSHVFVLFSRTENQPCVLLESFCCGLPVISTAVGGVPEIVTKENGLLIETGNIDQLVEKMKYMIENYHQYNRKKISDDAVAQYNYKKIGADINGIYSDIIQNQKA